MRSPNEIDNLYTKKQLFEKINSVKHWQHRIHLGQTFVTPGVE